MIFLHDGQNLFLLLKKAYILKRIFVDHDQICQLSLFKGSNPFL